ncbi:hypothetical protein QUW14_10625 [Bacteroides gallinaceum]|uniref:hypothetical protein n=1 Tax=Bacteroides gallinaceum TaxID=1462571 RepID=UPI0025A3D503|nr:hypothetical protein [Bacteroides gallinaceum]MDM8154757.1 hypothetical protein [Bacteroides gallinaceum]
MAEIIVTVGDNSLLPMLEKAISLLKGVTKVSVRKEKAKPEISSVNELPEDIQDLIGIASGFDQQEVVSDERLSYLLNK